MNKIQSAGVALLLGASVMLLSFVINLQVGEHAIPEVVTLALVFIGASFIFFGAKD